MHHSMLDMNNCQPGVPCRTSTAMSDTSGAGVKEAVPPEGKSMTGVNSSGDRLQSDGSSGSWNPRAVSHSVVI